MNNRKSRNFKCACTRCNGKIKNVLNYVCTILFFVSIFGRQLGKVAPRRSAPYSAKIFDEFSSPLNPTVRKTTMFICSALRHVDRLLECKIMQGGFLHLIIDDQCSPSLASLHNCRASRQYGHNYLYIFVLLLLCRSAEQAFTNSIVVNNL